MVLDWWVLLVGIKRVFRLGMLHTGKAMVGEEEAREGAVLGAGVGPGSGGNRVRYNGAGTAGCWGKACFLLSNCQAGVHVGTWAGGNKNLNLRIAHEKEIMTRCAGCYFPLR